jgi:hypothetical protein
VSASQPSAAQARAAGRAEAGKAVKPKIPRSKGPGAGRGLQGGALSRRAAAGSAR